LNYYTHGESDSLKGTIVVQTIKDILDRCKNPFVKMGVHVHTGYNIIRIDDITTSLDDSGNVQNTVLSQHYTMINQG
jgi:hypothetical protein